MRPEYDIAIIGGGAAGLTVASGAAQLGARTLLIEKEPTLGGDCLHCGCVPSKTLIHTARIYHQLGDTRRFGLPEAKVGPVDFRRIRERIREVIATIQVHDSVARFESLGARVEFGRPAFIDDHAVRLNGRTVSAEKWLIATGSSPAPPRVEVLRNIHLLTNREIFSLEQLPEELIVLGGGPIAVEMGQAFARLGSRVRIVQRSGQILSREDRDMAETVMEGMRADGVEFLLNATVVGAQEEHGRQRIEIEQEGRSRTLRADAVLLAQGRTPNLGGLDLDRAGVEHNHRGIAVDRRMRTSRPHIFAAGDVTGSYQFTHAAGYEGGIVVGNAIFHLPRKADYTWMPWCTYTDPELASIGMNEKTARAAGIRYSLWSETFADNDRAVAEGSGTGRLKLLLDRREKVIGVQIVGPRAGELICEWAALLGAGARLSNLAGAVHPYPTLAEINKRAAGSVLSKKLFSPVVVRILGLLFRLRGKP